MVNTSKLKLTFLQESILRHLFIKAGKTFTARALSIALGVSQPAISKALPNLEKENFVNVTKDKESKRLAIELNRENILIMGMKRADNLEQVYESGLYDFLFNEFPGCTIILFGSYSRGDDIFNSDIDLAIIGSKEKKVNLEKFEKILKKEVRINFYPSFKKIHKDLLTNIYNGIILVGSVEL